MSRLSLKTFLSASALVFTATVSTSIIAPSTSFAQEAPAPAENRSFSAATGEIVNAALQFITAGQDGAALGKLQEAIARTELNNYEKSTIYQMMGATEYELGQISQAISSFESSINSGGLLPNEVDSLRVNIAQLLIQNGSYARGAQMLEDWNRSGGQLTPRHIEILTQAWVQDENYGRALPWAQRWFDGASPKERKHFDLLNFLYNNLGQPAKQADIVRQMIARWPDDKTLWETWASMLANGGREQEAFEVKKMLYLGGALSSQSDLLQVVQYYSFYEMPFQAAQILEREMNSGRIQKTPDHLEQLSNLLRQAREYKRAIPVLEQAAQASDKAKLYIDLGEAYNKEKNCAKSEEAFKKGIDRGYSSSKAWMLIATCRYELSQAEDRIGCEMSPEQIRSAPRTKLRDDALLAFNRVPASSLEGNDAKKWKTFINAEENAVEKRCIFEKNVRKEQCYIAIERGYRSLFVTNGILELDDKGCFDFREAYDKERRPASAVTEGEGEE